MFWHHFEKQLEDDDETLTVLQRNSASQAMRRICAALSASPERGIEFFLECVREAHERFTLWKEPQQRFKAQMAVNQVFKDFFKSCLDALEKHDGEILAELDGMIAEQELEKKRQELEQEAANEVQRKLEEERAHRASLKIEADKVRKERIYSPPKEEE